MHNSSLFQYFLLISTCTIIFTLVLQMCICQVAGTKKHWMGVKLTLCLRHNDRYYQLLAETSQEQVLALFVRLLLTVILSLTLYWGQSEHLDDRLLVTIEQHKIHPFQLFSCQPSIPNNEETNKSCAWVKMLVAYITHTHTHACLRRHMLTCSSWHVRKCLNTKDRDITGCLATRLLHPSNFSLRLDTNSSP